MGTIRKCFVKLVDDIGTTHSVQVHAESVYEAVLLGLNRLSEMGWESERGGTVGSALVEVHSTPTMHEVNVPSFLRWLKSSSIDQNIGREKTMLRNLFNKR